MYIKRNGILWRAIDMKRVGILALILGFALCIPGCGFTEGTDAEAVVVRATPTPQATPTPIPPTATPTPEATPTPVPVMEQTPSGINVVVQQATYTVNSDLPNGLNLRKDADPNAESIGTVPSGFELTSTGVCENGWIRVDYQGQIVFASGDFVTQTAVQEAPTPADAAAPAADAAAEAPAADAAEAPAP